MAADPRVRSDPDEPPRRRRSWAQRDRIIPKTRQLTFSSRLLFRIDHYTSLPWAALVAAVVLLGAIVTGLFLGFRTGWLTSFEVATSVVTLMMLFVIQHTQGREQAATQRKLDELLRALPEAQSGLMMLEEASDDEMRDVELDQRESKENAVTTSDHPS